MLFLCPSQYRQEGAKRDTPVLGIHRWALWSVIMSPIVPSCLSALYQRDKQAGFSVHIFPFVGLNVPVCIFTALLLSILQIALGLCRSSTCWSHIRVVITAKLQQQISEYTVRWTQYEMYPVWSLGLPFSPMNLTLSKHWICFSLLICLSNYLLSVHVGFKFMMSCCMDEAERQ